MFVSHTVRATLASGIWPDAAELVTDVTVTFIIIITLS